MKTRDKLIVTTAALALAVGVGTYAFKASSQEVGQGFGPRFMRGMGHGLGTGMGHGPGTTGMGHGMMDSGSNSATAAEMHTIHELLANHDRIKRTVTNLPDGIRAVTDSDDPQIARLIKSHVAGMGERVTARNDPNLPIESPALHSIFRDKDKIKTSYETTANGIVVVQISTDPATVAALQQYAAEVTDLAKGGMAAIHTAVMKNGGGMMHGSMMHRSMMGRHEDH
jgi:hypothetical protein